MNVEIRDDQRPPAPEGGQSESRRALLAEIAAVVVLFAAPTFASLGDSLILGGSSPESEARQRARPEPAEFAAGKLHSAVLRLRYLPILLFVMWRSGQGWTRFGWVKPRLKDLLAGFGLWLIVAALDALIALAFGRRNPWFGLYPLPISWAHGAPLLLYCCAVALAEEVEMRAYLIPRLESLTGAAWKAVALSVLVFGFVHLYKGPVGVVHSLAAGAVWGAAFCLMRRLWPVMIAHALVDFVVGTHIGVPG